MKRIVILGASGSIGLQTVDVCKRNKDLFEVVAISVGKNIEVCIKLIKELNVKYVSVQNEEDAILLKKQFNEINIFYGDDGLRTLVELKDYDLLVNALVGFVGLLPTIYAIRNKKNVALANKETLVVGGDIVNKELKENNCKLYPIDSEHSAIFQCLLGNDKKEVKKLIITASGGSFRNLSREELCNVTVKDALDHPTWSMGPKITIDSATMMNKGFEVIEAHYLFDIPYDKIDVILHKQSVIHSMVEYVDGSIICQLANPDMRLPIQYAINYPERLEFENDFDFNLMKELNFDKIDFNRFPLLKLAYDVGKKAGNLGCILNAANEVANSYFRTGKISFLDIEKYIFDTVNNATYIKDVKLEDLIEIDKNTRLELERRINKL